MPAGSVAAKISGQLSVDRQVGAVLQDKQPWHGVDGRSRPYALTMTVEAVPQMMSLNTAALLAVSLATGKLKPQLGQGSASVLGLAARS